MGYIYEEVKKQMNGLNRKPGAGLIQNWSPNLYRCIIISQSFIFMAKHIGNPIIQPLDPMKVQEDLSSYARGQGRGSLHNLFSERQLSCLEEIYFDDIYKPFQNLFDINMYISKVKNSVSRLRYYGYCRTGGDSRIANWLVGTYQRADVLYCLAKDKNRVFPLEYKEVGEKGWYKNYNLRPQYYRLDADGGQLAIYFRKNEKNIEDLLKKYGENTENSSSGNDKTIVSSLMSAIHADSVNMHYIKRFNKIAMHVMNNRSNDDIAKLCYTSILCVIRKDRIVKGFNEKVLKELLKGKADDLEVNTLSGAYSSFMVYDVKSESKGTVDVDLTSVQGKESCGLLNITSMFDELCLTLSDEIMKDSLQKLLVEYNVSRHAGEIPSGRFRTKYLKSDSNVERSLDGYINYLSDLIGVDINTL